MHRTSTTKAIELLNGKNKRAEETADAGPSTGGHGEMPVGAMCFLCSRNSFHLAPPDLSPSI